jgi:hypothetical protein
VCGDMLLIAKSINESIEVKILTPSKEDGFFGLWIKAHPESYLHDLVDLAKTKLELYHLKKKIK